MTGLRFLQFALLVGFLVSSGCDQISPPVVTQADTACTPGQAQLQISDGYFKNLCGCVEPAGTLVPSPGTLTCTVPVGTVVFFYVVAGFTHHQIISTTGGTLTFPSGPVSDTGNTGEIQPYGVPFVTAGTADFEDAYDTALQGQIIVTP
jgi:hypothetical protein